MSIGIQLHTTHALITFCEKKTQQTETPCRLSYWLLISAFRSEVHRTGNRRCFI